MQQLTPEKQPRTFFLCCGFILVLCLGVIDYLTGAELSFSPLYLLPVFLAVWFAGRVAGVIVSAVSATTGLLADLFLGASYSHPLFYFWNAAMNLLTFVIIALLLSAWRDTLGTTVDSRQQDPLTGAKTLRCFFEIAHAEISRARRYHHPFTLVHVDIDDFQVINQSLGHRGGDALLQQVAQIIRESVRETDTVARLGGDDFAILLPEARYESSQRTILRMRENLVRAVGKKGVTFSIGAVTFMAPPVSVNEMIQHVDDLMRSARHNGKDTVRHEVWG